jgi:hypothetical protein
MLLELWTLHSLRARQHQQRQIQSNQGGRFGDVSGHRDTVRFRYRGDSEDSMVLWHCITQPLGTARHAPLPNQSNVDVHAYLLRS